MIEWFKRKTLISQGLCCDRTRLQAAPSELLLFLDGLPFLRWVILFVAFLAAIRVASWDSSLTYTHIVLSSVVVFLAVLAFMPLVARQLWESNQLLTLAAICYIFNVIINRSIVLFLDTSALGFLKEELTLAAALGPMLLTVLVSAQAGIFLAVLMAISDAMFISNGAYAPMTLPGNLLIACVGVLFVRSIRRRSDLLIAGAAVGGVGFVCEILESFLVGDFWSYFTIVQAFWALLIGMATTFVVGAILPILEWMFDRITDISWLELTDLNHPLLRRLQLEAPGTYHHSLMVANLAEAAAARIGCNPTMCRAMAYFHDVGKLHKPQFFIENTSADENPHNALSPSMSALIIIAHVKEGVSLAVQFGLPLPIIDGIQQHHGTTIIAYFYKKALQQEEDARLGSEILRLTNADVPEVNETAFQYPGPIPAFRESAILSMADAIESSSRSLREANLSNIEGLVQSIVQDRMEEGQLDQSGLTLDEIRSVSEQFVLTLKTMLHVRIPYPKERHEGEDVDYSDKPAKAPSPEPSQASATE